MHFYFVWDRGSTVEYNPELVFFFLIAFRPDSNVSLCVEVANVRPHVN